MQLLALPFERESAQDSLPPSHSQEEVGRGFSRRSRERCPTGLGDMKTIFLGPFMRSRSFFVFRLVATDAATQTQTQHTDTHFSCPLFLRCLPYRRRHHPGALKARPGFVGSGACHCQTWRAPFCSIFCVVVSHHFPFQSANSQLFAGV